MIVVNGDVAGLIGFGTHNTATPGNFSHLKLHCNSSRTFLDEAVLYDITYILHVICTKSTMQCFVTCLDWVNDSVTCP